VLEERADERGVEVIEVEAGRLLTSSFCSKAQVLAA